MTTTTAVKPVIRKRGMPHPPECWACGKTCPRQTHISKVGWHVRWTRIDHHRMREAYCPDCFARWGWPEETGVPK